MPTPNKRFDTWIRSSSSRNLSISAAYLSRSA
jgi:hypothetical protein